MANKKISELLATSPVVTATVNDEYETVQAGVSKGGILQKIIDLLASLNPFNVKALNVNGGVSTFATDGSAVIGSGRYNFNVDGSGAIMNDQLIAQSGVTIGAGQTVLNPDGSASLASGGSQFNADGSIVLPGITIDNAGNINMSGGVILLNNDGTATFSAGALRIEADGSITGQVSRTLFNHFADAGSVGAGETDLYSDSIAGNILAANGQKLVAEYGVALVNSVSTKRLRVYFGGTAIFDSGALTISASSEIVCYVTIQRVDVNTVRYSITANTTGASTGSFAQVGTLGGLNLGAANILKITGQAGGAGTANGDLTAKDAYVEFKP